MLKCVFVVEIWPFKSGPRRQKWGKNGGNGGGGGRNGPESPIPYYSRRQNFRLVQIEINCRRHSKMHLK